MKAATPPAAPGVATVKITDIAPVWAGHAVGFDLLTHGDQQFVLYYDADRNATLAQRTLPSGPWKFKKLPTVVGWDSHNYLTMAFDRDGILHLSGNMHVNPLVYFRASKPYDIESVEQVAAMTGQQEDRVTYPIFMTGANGELVFNYREGQSGSGDTYYNSYDEKSKTWTRLMDKPIFGGGGVMNAYPDTPVKGPDGYFHLVWVWRNSPMAETNHDPSYIRSRDLVHWETAAGKPLDLPITIDTPGLVIDPVPMKGGIINGLTHAGFDKDGKLLITYMKYDQNGKSQLYFARFVDGKWVSTQATQWDYRWDFAGGGSIHFDILDGPVRVIDGKMVVLANHKVYGGGYYEVDPVTLQLKGKVPAPDAVLPPELSKVTSTFPEMQVRWKSDHGTPFQGKTYRLRWETLDVHRDQPRDKPWPDPSMLQVVEITPPPAS